MKISLVYISLSGNTASFIKRLSTFLQERHENVEIEQVDIKDMVKEETILRHVSVLCSLFANLLRRWEWFG